MAPIYGVLIAYLAGSIPSAYIAGKLRGVDLRQHGSGNLGATNVVRVLGRATGAVVFLADVLKGFLPVFFLPIYTETLQPELWALVYGAALAGWSYLASFAVVVFTRNSAPWAVPAAL